VPGVLEFIGFSISKARPQKPFVNDFRPHHPSRCRVADEDDLTQGTWLQGNHGGGDSGILT
jgi:hypothetical protein